MPPPISPTTILRDRLVPTAIAHQLVHSGFSPLIAQLLASRGIQSASQCTPDLNRLHPPTLKGIDSAVTLILDALDKQWRVVVVGDYDCDGATATALLVSALRRLRLTTHYLIPNRETMGYGLSPPLAKVILSAKPDLAITVDNGIAAVEGVSMLRQAGIRVLITDHHLAGEVLPNADAIINPNQPHCPFPSKALAGVGVAFYLLIALRQALRKRGHADFPLNDYLDLVALGTVADLVPLDENNRILVHFGLKRLREGKARQGINALMQSSGRKLLQSSTGDLAFAIAPRINAAGRMSDMSVGIECLLVEEDSERAEQLAQLLNAINLERRHTETEMKEEAMAIVNGLSIADSARTITLAQPDWHVGVIGIVASRIKEQTGKPTFVFTQAGKSQWRGSGRSVAGLHLRDCLDWIAKKHPDLLVMFGGHAMAAGATLSESPDARFRQAFTESALVLCPTMRSPMIDTDGRLPLGDINLAHAKQIEQMVWGQGFPPPLFHDHFRIERWRHLKDRHWKLTVSHPQWGEVLMNALFFNVPESLTPSPSVTSAEFTYALSYNEYQGVAEIILRVEHWLSPTDH